MTEELKEEDLQKLVEKVNVNDVLLLLADVIIASGKQIKDVGEAISKRQETVRLAKLYSGSFGKRFGEKLLEEIPEEKLGPILKTIYKIGTPPDFTKLFDEPPEDIINKGKELVDLGTKLKRLVEGE